MLPSARENRYMGLSALPFLKTGKTPTEIEKNVKHKHNRVIIHQTQIPKKKKSKMSLLSTQCTSDLQVNLVNTKLTVQFRKYDITAIDTF